MEIPALKDASYRVEQDLSRGVTRGTFSNTAVTLHLETGVAATENLLWIDLSAEGGALEGQITAKLPDERAKETADSGVTEGASRREETQLLWRFFERGVRVKTGAACAVRVLGGGSTFRLVPGKTVRIVAVTSSQLQANDPRESAVRANLAVDETSLRATRLHHEAWWRDFWSRSSIEIPDKLLEQRYYLSQYVLASGSRDLEFPPGLFGWVTTDHSRWNGNYFLNYNFFAPFYGLYAANHIEQAGPCSHPLFRVAERTGKDKSVRTPDIEGIYQCRAIAPMGCFRAAGRPFAVNGKSPEQKSNGAYSCVPLAMHWYATYDLDFGKQAYPYVKGVATFWEHWLKFENGQYNDYNDPVHEESGPDVNALHSLALCRMVMSLALDMSKELGVDADRRDKWVHIRDHLAPYPTCTVRELPKQFWPKHLAADEATLNLPIFRYTATGTPWWVDNTVGIQHIFPAGGIGLDSPPELLERARNQIKVMNRWVDFNGMNSFYAAAARVGYEPRIILAEMHRMVATIGGPNGMLPGNPHGMEHLSIVPNAIQEMLMQSHEGVIRFFPCWPQDQDARFRNLRAFGAFLVSADYRGGTARNVQLVSEKGRPCTVQNPWPGTKVALRREGKPAEVLTGSRFTFQTKPGEQLLMAPASSR
jgi:hypothetical protein